MIKKIHKIFIDYKKEEKWLNEMTLKGFNLVSYNFLTYRFEIDSDIEYIYRIELLEYPPKHNESIKYMEFLEESNIEFVDSYFNWVYFKKRKNLGVFQLYTDTKSKIMHYKRILMLIVPIAFLNFIAGIGNIVLWNIFMEKVFYLGYINILMFFILFITIVHSIYRINKLEKEKIVHE